MLRARDRAKAKGSDVGSLEIFCGGYGRLVPDAVLPLLSIGGPLSLQTAPLCLYSDCCFPSTYLVFKA